MPIYDTLQERQIKNGGYDLGVNQTLDYVKPKDINKYHLENSIMFPPCYTNDAEMPAEAIVNYQDLTDSLIAKILPPLPIVAGAKYTFFYVAPAAFKYPDGKRIWLPVYILVPGDSKEKPTDLREFESYKIQRLIGEEENHQFLKSKMMPIWTPTKFEQIIMNKGFFNMPQKPLESEFFLDPKRFDEFLDEYDLINEGVKMKDTEVKKVYTDPIRKLFKKAVEFFKFENGLKSAI